MRIMVLARSTLQFTKYFPLSAARCGAPGCAVDKVPSCTEGFPTHSCLPFLKISLPGSQVNAILAPLS